ncbi:MAG: hypothetical protein AAGU27_24890 [Dehalobacterium sp.]
MKNFSFKVTLIFVIMMVIFITACNQTGKTNPEPEDNKSVLEENDSEKEISPPKDQITPDLSDYFPLSQGSTWQYLGEGNEYASFKREVIFAEGNRGQIKEDNGGTVSAVVFDVTDEAITRVFFQGESYENDNFLNAEPNDNLVILKAPLQVGTKWETDDSSREIVDLNASLDTPAGNFEKVLKMKITFPDSTMFEYYKDGVGMIKREYISGDFKVTSTLEKYEIRKP